MNYVYYHLTMINKSLSQAFKISYSTFNQQNDSSSDTGLMELLIHITSSFYCDNVMEEGDCGLTFSHQQCCCVALSHWQNHTTEVISSVNINTVNAGDPLRGPQLQHRSSFSNRITHPRMSVCKRLIVCPPVIGFSYDLPIQLLCHPISMSPGCCLLRLYCIVLYFYFI